MADKGNKLYVLLSFACIVGYGWLFRSYTATEYKSVEMCLLKHVTTVPCPSCGTTRSVISLMKGNFFEALKINPFGYAVGMIMLFTPLWVFFDLTTKRRTLFHVYRKIEQYLNRPKYAIPLVLMVIINWIWNINKGL